MHGLLNNEINSFTNHQDLRFRSQAILIAVFLFSAVAGFTQTRFSLATDFSVLRSFKSDQRYWAVGQTVAGHFHLSPRDGLFVWISYYSNGKFSNQYEATARSIFTNPYRVNFDNRSKLSFKHISMGWKHYLCKNPTNEKGMGWYGLAGLGLMIGRIENSQSQVFDTTVYNVPVFAGKGNFKRLTLDLGTGVEVPIGADIYIYTEAKAMIPVSYYPSNYLFNSKYAPLTGCFNIGLRILFN